MTWFDHEGGYRRHCGTVHNGDAALRLFVHSSSGRLLGQLFAWNDERGSYVHVPKYDSEAMEFAGALKRCAEQAKQWYHDVFDTVKTLEEKRALMQSLNVGEQLSESFALDFQRTLAKWFPELT